MNPQPAAGFAGTPASIALRGQRAFNAARRFETDAGHIADALRWLAAEGFDVIQFSSELDRPMPVIEIETCAKCQWLIDKHGAREYRWEKKDGNRVTRYRATILGCRVEWNVRGH